MGGRSGGLDPILPPERDDFGPQTEIDPETSRTTRRIARIRSVLGYRQTDLRVVLENVHDPHNVSAVLRTCDAVGVDTIHLLYTREEFPTIGRASSAGVARWMNLEHHDSVDDCFEALAEAGCRVYGTSLADSPESIYDTSFWGPVAVVFGNEHRGVSEEVLARVDGTIRIPMVGFVESLNISVACAVTLYEAMRQRIAAGSYSEPMLSDEEIDRRTREWSEPKKR